MARMITNTALVASVFLIFGLGPAMAGPPPITNETDAKSSQTLEEFKKQAFVTVNGEPITGAMLSVYFAERMQTMPNKEVSPQIQNMFLNDLINIFLLSQVAHETQFASRPEVVLALELQRKELLSRMVLQGRANSFTPTEEMLKKAYDESYATPSPEYKASHILVKTEDEAKAIITQLDQGVDFALLAKEHSLDSNAKKGGDLGWFGAMQMVKPFADAVAKLEIGTISTQPVQTKFGWHIIKLEDKRTETPPTFEAVKSRLVAEVQRSALGDYLDKLRSQAKVDVKAPVLPSTPEDAAAK